MAELLEMQDNGLYCAQGDFYIDPLKSVKKALITHAHMDHARAGSDAYLATPLTVGMMKYRLGEGNYQEINYGEKITINQVQVSFHPASHVPGSAQIRLEYKGEVWVVSGDYKVADDGLSEALEIVPCNTFITECTFGLPVFKWKPQEIIAEEINNWWKKVSNEGGVCILGAYSLGKAQRVLHLLDYDIGPVYQHNAVFQSTEILRSLGVPLPEGTKLDKEMNKNEFNGTLIVMPPVAMDSAWTKKLKNKHTGMASGWMHLRGTRRRRSVDRGFVLSDHADWNGLLSTVKGTGAENVIVTHGYEEVFSKYLREKGYNSWILGDGQKHPALWNKFR